MAETPDDVLRWALPELKRSLRALALPAEAQLGLFPDFVCKADELALDLDEWYRRVASNGAARVTDEQRHHLAALDARLSAMSGP